MAGLTLTETFGFLIMGIKLYLRVMKMQRYQYDISIYIFNYKKKGLVISYLFIFDTIYKLSCSNRTRKLRTFHRITVVTIILTLLLLFGAALLILLLIFGSTPVMWVSDDSNMASLSLLSLF